MSKGGFQKMFSPKDVPPVLIIAFLRPEGVSKLLDQISLAGVKEVFISIDGPRSPEEARVQNEILSVVHTFDNRFSIKIRHQQSNGGVAIGVLGALDWFFSQVDCGIVLEDDLVIHQDVVMYFSRMLNIYRDVNDIYMISGTQVFEKQFTQSIEGNIPMIWGWAMWSDKWTKVRARIFDVGTVEMRHMFSKNYGYWWVGAMRANLCIVDTWDAQLAFQFFINGWRCVVPPFNLVSNWGADENATHTLELKWPLHLPLFQGKLPESTFEISNSEISRSYNKEMDARLFNIKFKHRFLLLLNFIPLRIRMKLDSKNSLKNRLADQLQAH